MSSPIKGQDILPAQNAYLCLGSKINIRAVINLKRPLIIEKDLCFPNKYFQKCPLILLCRYNCTYYEKVTKSVYY